MGTKILKKNNKRKQKKIAVSNKKKKMYKLTKFFIRLTHFHEKQNVPKNIFWFHLDRTLHIRSTAWKGPLSYSNHPSCNAQNNGSRLIKCLIRGATYTDLDRIQENPLRNGKGGLDHSSPLVLLLGGGGQVCLQIFPIFLQAREMGE